MPTPKIITLPDDPEFEALLKLLPEAVTAMSTLRVHLDKPWGPAWATDAAYVTVRADEAPTLNMLARRFDVPQLITINTNEWVAGRLALVFQWGLVYRSYQPDPHCAARLSVYVTFDGDIIDVPAYIMRYQTELCLVDVKFDRPFTAYEQARMALRPDLPMPGFMLHARYPELEVDA